MEVLQARPRDAGGRLRTALLGVGVAAGAALAVVIAVFFDPVNLFALRLQEGILGSTAATTLWIGVALAFVSGMTMVFTPCGMPLIFTLNAIAREGRQQHRGWVTPFGLFALAMAAVMAAWGTIVGLAGGAVVEAIIAPGRRLVIAEALYSMLGVLALAMALWELGWIKLPRLNRARGIPARLAALGPYPRSLGMGAALGGGFGIGCPFPTYHAVLAWVVVVGNPAYGALALAANAVGRAAPFFVFGALVYGGSEQRRISGWLVGNAARAKLVSGTALAAFGSLMLVLWAVLVPFVVEPG